MSSDLPARPLPQTGTVLLQLKDIFWPPVVLILLSVVAALAWVLPLGAPERAVAAPAAVLGCLAIILVGVLWYRDRVLPVFELGTMCAITTAVYSMAPLMGYYFAGLEWTILSDNRLFSMNPDPFMVGGFFWRHVLYLATFVVVYLAARGRTFVATKPLAEPAPGTGITALFTAILFSGYFWVIEVYTGVVYNMTHADIAEGKPLTTTLPYFIQQISHNFAWFVLLSKQWLIMLLMRRWSSPRWRAVLITWLAAEVLITVVRMGQRTSLAILLLSAALMYHRLVKPLTFRKSMAGIILGFGGLLAYGLFRDIFRHIGAAIPDLGIPLASAATEFQILFGTSFDLYVRKITGTLPSVPWTVYWGDLLMLIPRQLLPFYKWDPSEWYLEVYGARNTGFGAMFGVMSQAVIGYDWVELMFRGAALGLLFAWIHRWYVRNAHYFWPTALYLALVIWSYYTYRASTFYIVYFVIYSWLPGVLLIRVGSALLSGARPHTAAAAKPPGDTPELAGT